MTTETFPEDEQALQRQADLESVAAWEGQLSTAAYRRALEICSAPPDGAEGRLFLDRLFLVAGAALILSGVIFFFAYNWAGLGKFQKLGLLEAALAALVAAAWRAGLEHLAGRVLLGAASVLVGPLLAVYGQAYQTGADDYTLFLTWALLVLPWVAASQTPALWLLPVALLNTALVLYWSQVAPDGKWFFMMLAGLDGAAWLAWERMRRRGLDWMSGRGMPRVLGVLTTGWLTIPGCIVAAGEARDAADFLSLLLLVGLWRFLLRHYRIAEPDLFMLAVALTSVVCVATTLAGYTVFAVLELETFGLLVLALVLLAEVGWAARWLRQVGSPGGREGSPA